MYIFTPRKLAYFSRKLQVQGNGHKSYSIFKPYIAVSPSFIKTCKMPAKAYINSEKWVMSVGYWKSFSRRIQWLQVKI